MKLKLILLYLVTSRVLAHAALEIEWTPLRELIQQADRIAVISFRTPGFWTSDVKPIQVIKGTDTPFKLGGYHTIRDYRAEAFTKGIPPKGHLSLAFTKKKDCFMGCSLDGTPPALKQLAQREPLSFLINYESATPLWRHLPAPAAPNQGLIPIKNGQISLRFAPDFYPQASPHIPLKELLGHIRTIRNPLKYPPETLPENLFRDWPEPQFKLQHPTQPPAGFQAKQIWEWRMAARASTAIQPNELTIIQRGLNHQWAYAAWVAALAIRAVPHSQEGQKIVKEALQNIHPVVRSQAIEGLLENPLWPTSAKAALILDGLKNIDPERPFAVDPPHVVGHILRQRAPVTLLIQAAAQLRIKEAVAPVLKWAEPAYLEAPGHALALHSLLMQTKHIKLQQLLLKSLTSHRSYVDNLLAAFLKQNPQKLPQEIARLFHNTDIGFMQRERWFIMAVGFLGIAHPDLQQVMQQWTGPESSVPAWARRYVELCRKAPATTDWFELAARTETPGYGAFYWLQKANPTPDIDTLNRWLAIMKKSPKWTPAFKAWRRINNFPLTDDDKAILRLNPLFKRHRR